MAEENNDALLQAVLPLSEDIRIIRNTVVQMNQEIIYLREDGAEVKADVRQLTRAVEDFRKEFIVEIRELRHVLVRQDELEQRIGAIEAKLR